MYRMIFQPHSNCQGTDTPYYIADGVPSTVHDRSASKFGAETILGFFLTLIHNKPYKQIYPALLRIIKIRRVTFFIFE